MTGTTQAAAGDQARELGRPTDVEHALSGVIAQRLRQARLAQNLTVGQLAERSGMSKGMLSKIENAQASPSLATLARLSAALSMPVTAFFRGLDEERDVLFVRAGRGLEILHRGTQAGNRYQMLGSMRGALNRMEPMLVTLLERSEVFPLYQHAGTELLYMLSGTMEYGYGDAVYLLAPGDALQFNGEVTHGPKSLLTLPIQFLSIKAYTAAHGG